MSNNLPISNNKRRSRSRTYSEIIREPLEYPIDISCEVTIKEKMSFVLMILKSTVPIILSK